MSYLFSQKILHEGWTCAVTGTLVILRGCKSINTELHRFRPRQGGLRLPTCYKLYRASRLEVELHSQLDQAARIHTLHLTEGTTLHIAIDTGNGPAVLQNWVWLNTL